MKSDRHWGQTQNPILDLCLTWCKTLIFWEWVGTFLSPGLKQRATPFGGVESKPNCLWKGIEKLWPPDTGKYILFLGEERSQMCDPKEDKKERLIPVWDGSWTNSLGIIENLIVLWKFKMNGETILKIASYKKMFLKFLMN